MNREIYYAGKEELLLSIRKSLAVPPEPERMGKRGDYMSSYGG